MILASVLDRAGDSLGGYLPRLGGALVLLLAGLLVAALLRRAVERGLRAAGVDGLGDRWGVHDVLERFGMSRSLSRLLARAVRIAVIIVACFAALSLLGLAFLSETLNEGILFLPQLFVALVLLLAGMVLGEMARRQVDRLAGQMDLPGPLGRARRGARARPLRRDRPSAARHPDRGRARDRRHLARRRRAHVRPRLRPRGPDMAREVSARRYVEAGFDVGQEISVEGVRGRIAAIETTCTVLETGDGERVRVPNSQLIARSVTEHAAT